MTHWDYRVVQQDDGDLGIYEVYYDDNGRPTSISSERVAPSADSADSLRAEYQRLMKSFDREVLFMRSFNARG